jgi:hypothetical protein
MGRAQELSRRLYRRAEQKNPGRWPGRSVTDGTTQV